MVEEHTPCPRLRRRVHLRLLLILSMVMTMKLAQSRQERALVSE